MSTVIAIHRASANNGYLRRTKHSSSISVHADHMTDHIDSIHFCKNLYNKALGVLGWHSLCTLHNDLSFISWHLLNLQPVQNTVTLAVTKTTKHHHITSVLKTLYWLKIPKRIEHKVISLTYKTLQSSQLSYLPQLFRSNRFVQLL